MFRSSVFCVLFVSVVFISAEDFTNSGYQNWIGEDHFLYPLLPITAPLARNQQCKEDSRALIQGIKNETLWAMQMWDSTAHGPVGILSGNTFQLGHYDECLAVQAPVKAQYCLAWVTAKYIIRPSDIHHDRHSLNPPPTDSVWEKFENSRVDWSQLRRDIVTWGLCVPASCSPEELEDAINQHLKASNSTTKYQVRFQEGSCTPAEEESAKDMPPSEVVFWFFSSLLCLVTGVSTGLDFFISKQKKKNGETKAWRMLMCFSLLRNVKKLLEAERSSDRLLPVKDTTDSPLSIFHGIKVISIVLIFLGHRLGIFIGISDFNNQAFEESQRHWINTMTVAHTDLIVDTFFFISGLLVCYLLIDLYSERFINPLLLIIARLIRLAPLYFFIVWFQTYPVLRFGSGPLWNTIGKMESQLCVDNWWTNMLFINNYIPASKVCMLHSWFIPCDLQSFIISIPIIILIARRRTFGLIVLCLATVVATAAPAIITFLHELEPLVLFYNNFFMFPRDNEAFNTLYRQTHNRISVYFIGMLTGYFLNRVKDSKLRISMQSMCGGLFIWIAFMFAPMAYGSVFYDARRPYDVTEAAIFASFRRVSWALGFSAFIITHRFKPIPIVGYLLSSRPAFVVGKVTYSLYLIHFNLLMAHMQVTRTPEQFSPYQVLVSFLGYLVTALVYATALYLVIELPIKQFASVIMSNKRRTGLPQIVTEKTQPTVTRSESDSQSRTTFVIKF